MTKDIEARHKVCQLCGEEYPEEDNYCGIDGTRLAMADKAKPVTNTNEGALASGGDNVD